MSLSYPEFQDVAQRARSFSEVTAFTVPGIEAEFLRMRSILAPLIISALMLIVAAGVSYWSSVQPAANESGMEPEPERVGLMLQ